MQSTTVAGATANLGSTNEAVTNAAAASSTTTNGAQTPSSPSTVATEESGIASEGEDDSVLEVEERELAVSTSFTTDEDLCLEYFLPDGEADQPKGKKGRITKEDISTFIEGTEKMHCLLIPKAPGLQLLHSAFMWEDWVYASATTSRVNDYWVRIPMKALLKPMVGLDFELRKTEGCRA
mmetsp:Transcript_53470/g.58082  ORF Transcript_53470/g.58082 Transcript_53470/m.58082 type:complete len:180 (-) Transcript_53470:36-575(-)